MALRWILHDDGSFDVVGGKVALRGGYPVCDDRPLRCVRVEVRRSAGSGTVRYHLAGGRVDMRFGREGRALVLAAALRGRGAAPLRLAPIGGARVEGADRFFRQGIGFGDHSGFRAIPSEKPVTGYNMAGLVAPDDATLVVAARDHRRFLLKFALYPAFEDLLRSRFDAVFRTEGVPLGREALALPALYLSESAAPWEGLRAEAAATAAEMGARTHQPQFYHWCSWYYLYYHMTEQNLAEYLAGFNALRPRVPLQTVQIDAGYFDHCGDWLTTNGRWPSGLQAAFEKIAAAGYRPGIWVAPFMVGCRSRLATEHPEWLLRQSDGALVTLWRHYYEDRVWGIQDEETYVLDSSHPGAMEYLRTVFRTLRRWGATFFKTDFLFWGVHDSATVRRHTPGQTSVEYLRDVLAMIREEIGEESFWLGCIAPFASLVGYVDANRIAGDVSAHWNGCKNMLEESIGCQHLNNVWFQNDPDAIMLRQHHSHMSDADARSLALWMGMLGGVVDTSDALHELPPERLALWRFLEPGPRQWTARYPFWGRPRPLEVMVREFPERRAWAVLILNPGDAPAMQRLPLDPLVGEKAAWCFTWGPEGHEPLGRCAEVVPELPPHHSVLYYVSKASVPPPAGLTLGGAVAGPEARRTGHGKRKRA
ncbi:MAG TPA: glycoside hydrolase family 36 protein [Vicinamibacterales bacterium]|nr:glycoside hydrolase family 36 protein [Phycisphaerae bacterium]HUU35792.1 glycoside hydrolase family 36 protein [Vicinamibacterales bacterium]